MAQRVRTLCFLAGYRCGCADDERPAVLSVAIVTGVGDNLPCLLPGMVCSKEKAEGVVEGGAARRVLCLLAG